MSPYYLKINPQFQLVYLGKGEYRSCKLRVGSKPSLTSGEENTYTVFVYILFFLFILNLNYLNKEFIPEGKLIKAHRRKYLKKYKIKYGYPIKVLNLNPAPRLRVLKRNKFLIEKKPTPAITHFETFRTAFI